MSEFYTSKVLVEVEVTTQFGPTNAVSLIKSQLKCPAVKSIHIQNVLSNFKVHSPPMKEMVDFPELSET